MTPKRHQRLDGRHPSAAQVRASLPGSGSLERGCSLASDSGWVTCDRRVRRAVRPVPVALVDSSANVRDGQALRGHEHGLPGDVHAHLTIEGMIGPDWHAVAPKAFHEAIQDAAMPFIDTPAIARDPSQDFMVLRRVGIRSTQIAGQPVTPPARGRQVGPCRRPGRPRRTSCCTFELHPPLNQSVMTSQVPDGDDDHDEHDDADYRQRHARGPRGSNRTPKVAWE